MIYLCSLRLGDMPQIARTERQCHELLPRLAYWMYCTLELKIRPLHCTASLCVFTVEPERFVFCLESAGFASESQAVLTFFLIGLSRPSSSSSSSPIVSST